MRGIRWTLGLVVLATGVGQAAVLEGTISKVIDGDSLVFEPAVQEAPATPAPPKRAKQRPAPVLGPLEVRLEGIDAPEGCQPGGVEAREALRAYVDGKTVVLKTQGLDGYKRTLATLMVDGTNINERMVAEGQAWSTRFKWDKGPYVEKERVAKSLKRGLHATSGAILPKDFRARNGPCTGEPSEVPGNEPAALPSTAAPATTAKAIYRCDGRLHCSQMTSCAEATWFLNHCPGTKMDGNGDGVPCERQWCR